MLSAARSAWSDLRDAPRRGRGAQRPWQIPPAGWFDVLGRVRRRTFDEHLTLLASGIAYHPFLALVPSVVAIALIYGLAASPANVARDMAALIEIVPGGGEMVLTRRLTNGLGSRQSDVIGAATTILLTLYTASLFARAVMAAMNMIYSQPRRRGFLRRWVVAGAIALSGGTFLLMAVCGVALLDYVETFIPDGTPLVWNAIRIGFWCAMAVAATVGFALIYRFALARADPRWSWCVPGAVGATMLWLAATYGFGIYVANFARYDAAYGSLAAVVVLQVWMFLSAIALLLGARLNVALERQTAVDTTIGPPELPGERNAVAADHVDRNGSSSQGASL